MRRSEENGFALTDALVAAVIAASVAIAAAQTLGMAAQSTKAARNLNAVMSEAETIAARLDAGLVDDQALTEGLSDWTIERAPYAFGNRRAARTEARPLRMIITHQASPAFSFERIIIAEGGL